MRNALARINARAAALALAGLALLCGVALGAGIDPVPGGDDRGSEATPRVALQTVAGVPAAERARKGKRGPRGRRGPEGERGPTGPQGPRGPTGSSDEHVLDVGVDWNGSANAAGHDSASVELPGIGNLAIECPSTAPADDPAIHRMVLTPSSAGRRTVANLTTFQGAGQNAATNERLQSDDLTPIVVPIPRNGMISGIFSVEPSGGSSVDAGAMPVADMTLSSYWKDNDPILSENTCHISAQLIAEGA
jgi:hypothetical protein